MKGSHRIIVETARIKYDFTIRRNITVIKGDSATGKTTLVGLLQAYSVRGEKSGVMLTSDVPCYVYSGDMTSWRAILSGYSPGIVFIDEDYSFVLRPEFADFVRASDHYYVMITRRDLTDLPYSIHEIYGIRTSGKFHYPQKIYNEFYQIYSDEYDKSLQNPVLITEDSKAGFQFFSRVCDGITCISAEGNSNIYRRIRDANPEDNLIVIADGAAFGAFIAKVLTIAEWREHIMLFFPESFEWMILKSGIIHSARISEILEHPEDFIESSLYFSWEQFFTELLQRETSRSAHLRYDKSQIPETYIQKRNAEKILQVLPDALQDYLSASSESEPSR